MTNTLPVETAPIKMALILITPCHPQGCADCCQPFGKLFAFVLGQGDWQCFVCLDNGEMCYLEREKFTSVSPQHDLLTAFSIPSPCPIFKKYIKAGSCSDWRKQLIPLKSLLQREVPANPTLNMGVELCIGLGAYLVAQIPQSPLMTVTEGRFSFWGWKFILESGGGNKKKKEKN